MTVQKNSILFGYCFVYHIVFVNDLYRRVVRFALVPPLPF